MAKFEFTNNNNNTIRHLPSGVICSILLNPEDGLNYDKFNDAYQEFQFLGNYIIALWDNETEFEEVEDYSYYNSILKQAFKFYKANVTITKFEAVAQPDAPMEDEYYKLTPTATGWSLIDKLNPFIIAWKHMQYNDTHQVIAVGSIDANDYMEVARVLGEAGGWLTEWHQDKI